MAKSQKKNDKTKDKKTDKDKKDSQSKKILTATFLLIFITIGSLTALYLYFPPVLEKKKKISKKVIKIDNKKPVSTNKKILKKIDKPIYELYSDTEHHKDIPKEKQDYKGLPKISIIIDDIGYDRKSAIAFSRLDIPITLSVLPYTPFGKEIMRRAKNKNTEFMLHLPMEPKEYPKIDPGKGALLSHMNPDELIRTLEDVIRWIPEVKGVNNHMGSHLTEDSDKMKQVFVTIKKKNLYFVDSLTSSKSKCMGVARLFMVDFTKRDIFLDNIQKEEYIKGQINKLKKIAVKRGYAVGIGHPYPATVEALKHSISQLKKEVVFVKASSIVKNIQ